MVPASVTRALPQRIAQCLLETHLLYLCKSNFVLKRFFCMVSNDYYNIYVIFLNMCGLALQKLGASFFQLNAAHSQMKFSGSLLALVSLK